LLAGLIAACFPAGAATDLRLVAVVKLYSDGKLVAEYESIDKGYQDGDCYVFHIKEGLRPRKVRVCGTYVVEEVD
jgi:hypothetical protein